MGKISEMVGRRYPRASLKPRTTAYDAGDQAMACIRDAAGRNLVTRTFVANPGAFRSAVMSDKIPFLSVWDEREHFLSIFPKEIRPTSGKIGLRDAAEVTVVAHPFTQRETDILDKAMPYLEPLLGETTYFFEHVGGTPAGQMWDQGMRPADELFYQMLVHPLILDELKHLSIQDNALVCEPACGRGHLLSAIRAQHPKVRIVGGELNQELVAEARRLNPSIGFHVGSAQELEYLDLGTVSLFVFSGLLNKSVVEKADAVKIFHQAITRSKGYGYFVITGKTPPLFSEIDLIRMGAYTFVRTKWNELSFHPCYIGIFPRTVNHGGGQVEVIPIMNELMQEEV